MRHHQLRSALAALTLVSFTLLAACGGSEGSAGFSGGASGADEDAGTTADAADVAEDDAGGGDRAEVPGSGVSFSEAMNADDLTPEQSSELQITLSVLGLDHPGYVAGSTIVAVTSEDDLEDRQFTCIAAGQVTEKEYEVVVVDQSGEVLDC